MEGVLIALVIYNVTKTGPDSLIRKTGTWSERIPIGY